MSKELVLPEAMWSVMEPVLRHDLTTVTNKFQRELMERYGVRTHFRLRSGLVKTDVRVNWDGRVVEEWYEEWGVRAEKYGPPRFTSEDLESWGCYDKVREPTLLHPFKVVRVWKVRVRADGTLG